VAAMLGCEASNAKIDLSSDQTASQVVCVRSWLRWQRVVRPPLHRLNPFSEYIWAKQSAIALVVVFAVACSAVTRCCGCYLRNWRVVGERPFCIATAGSLRHERRPGLGQ
jgi:hypothetical protein